MKVHHEGFLEAQPQYLAGQTGVPGMEHDIEMSDMYRSSEMNGNHVKTDGTA
jgi:hypothetical protein